MDITASQSAEWATTQEVVHRGGETACADAPDDDAQKEGECGAFVFEDVGEFHFKRLLREDGRPIISPK